MTSLHLFLQFIPETVRRSFFGSNLRGERQDRRLTRREAGRCNSDNSSPLSNLIRLCAEEFAPTNQPTNPTARTDGAALEYVSGRRRNSERSGTLKSSIRRENAKQKAVKKGESRSPLCSDGFKGVGRPPLPLAS